MRNFRGFTLTELMVALAVIGILTAVVTPAVMKIKPNKNKMMVKKAYYTAENIISSLINNQLYYPDMSAVCLDSSMANGTNIYCAGGFDYTEPVTDADGVTYGGSENGGETKKFANLFQSRLNVQTGTCYSDDGCTTTDGMTWYLPSWSKTDSSATIIVDVNGAGKAPDCLQTDTGCSVDDFDKFRINVREDGRMSINAEDTGAIEYISINASVARD